MSDIKCIIASLFPYGEYENGVLQIQGISEHTKTMLVGCYKNLCALACDNTNSNQMEALKEVANQFNSVKLENANAKIASLTQQLKNANAEIAVLTQQLESNNSEIAFLKQLLENANAEIALINEQFGY